MPDPLKPEDDSDFDIDIDDSDLEFDSDIDEPDRDSDIDEDDSDVVDNTDDKKAKESEDQQLADFYKKHPEQYGKWIDTDADFIHSEDEKEGMGE